MIEIRLSLSLSGNYGCEITKKNPELGFEVISGYSSGKFQHGLLRFRVSSKVLKMYEFLFLNYDYVKEFKVLEKSMAEIVLERSEKDLPFSHHVHMLKGFYIYPIVFENGRQICTVVFESRKRFSELLKRVGCEVKILKIKDITLGTQNFPDLTEKQLKAVDLALKKGYFDLPKSIGLDELSSKMKVSKTTFLEHLRKAEKKILENYLKA
ncbi:MAG: helix-turn-helix domain-containing protein [Candidatus Methanofastidiosia archaeon]